MAGLLTPILEEVQTALRATMNTEKDTLDSTLDDILSGAIRIQYPGGVIEDDIWVNIFPWGETVPNQESNITDNIPWGVVTEVLVNGDNSETLIKAADVYTSAMMKSIIKHGADWTLNGACDLLRVVLINPEEFDGQQDGEIATGNFIQWIFDREYNLTS